MMRPKEYRSLVDAAARLYLRVGWHPYFFARGKLGYDPIFPELLRRGLFRDRARILDLGCGQGVLGALLVAARGRFETGAWPQGWPEPPRDFTLHGIDLRPEVVQWAQAAIGNRATFLAADLRDADLPDADLVVILDMLHYLEPQAQQRVLAAVARALRNGGTLLLRVGDASAGFRFWFTRFHDNLSALIRGQGWSAHYCHSAGEWAAMLERLGFEVAQEPMSAGTPFANVLLIAHVP